MSTKSLLLAAFTWSGVLVSCSCTHMSSPPEVKPETSSAPVAVPTLPRGKSIGIDNAGAATKVAIEKIHETWSPLVAQPVPIPAGTAVAISGWAIDDTKKTPAGAVDVLIDGMPYGAEYGIERGDVADFLKNPAYRGTGFKVTVPASKLVERGHHEVTVRVIANDMKSFYEGPKIDVEVR